MVKRLEQARRQLRREKDYPRCPVGCLRGLRGLERICLWWSGAGLLPAFPALALGASCRAAYAPDREEPGVARADAGESLRLTSNAQSAKWASCSKIPRRRACHPRRTNPVSIQRHPYSPRSRLGLPDGRQGGRRTLEERLSRFMAPNSVSAALWPVHHAGRLPAPRAALRGDSSVSATMTTSDRSGSRRGFSTLITGPRPSAKISLGGD